MKPEFHRTYPVHDLVATVKSLLDSLIAGAKEGIAIKGWHTLRHSYTTLLRQNNDDPKVVQALLRHNSIKVTMDVYDEAMSDEKQVAHRKVLRLVTRKQTRTVMRTASESGVAVSA